VPTTLSTLEEMFRELGGVPKRIVSDNPKCFAIEAKPSEKVIIERICPKRWRFSVGQT